MTSRSSLLLGFALLTCALPCAAAQPQLRVCSEDQPFWPMANSDPALPGDGQILFRMAAERVGVGIVEVFASWRRCQEMLEAGSVDALNGASFAAINRAIASFPMDGNRDDASKSLGVMTTYLFRRAGTRVQLRDGEFVDLRTRVGIMNAYQLNNISVGRRGGIADDNSRTRESLMRRLTSGELDLVAGTDEMRRLCAGPYAGLVEVLAEPLDEAPYYLAFSKAYHAANAQRVEAIWGALAQLRDSPAYRARLRQEAPRRSRAFGRNDCPLAP